MLPIFPDMHHLSAKRPTAWAFALAVLELSTVCHAVPAVAQSSPRMLAKGVEYRVQTDSRGPWKMHVVRIDLRGAEIELRHARARDELRGRERPSAMVQRARTAGWEVLATVNADFFNLQTGENENNQVIGGEWWKGLKVTESPYDTYDNVHAQFALDAKGMPSIDRYILDGKAWGRAGMTPLIAVNANPSGAPEGTALFTPRFGATTPRDTARVTAEVGLAQQGQRGDTLLFVRRGAASNASGSAIPQGGAVLAAYGARTKELLAMAEGDTIRVLLTTVPRLSRNAAPSLLIGGWPTILRDGQNVAGDAATIEGTISRNAEVRHPRTAIGYSRDRKTLWLLTVDGRTTASVGMTLIEMADVMRSMGVWNAMNFDGGGSTTMVIDGTVVNTPSDATGEREVGNVLMVVRRRTPTGR